MFSRALVCLLLAGIAPACRRSEPASPELNTPAIALGRLGKESGSAQKTDSLYWNAAALPWLLKEQIWRVRDEDHRGDSPRMRAFAQAAQSPQLFRELDRELRFDAVWLLGDPSTYKPLLEHLLETKDFTLGWLDHTSLIFHRGTQNAWQPAQLDDKRAQFRGKRAQASFLAEAATKLLAIKNTDEAKRRLEHAEKLDGKSPAVHAVWASYHLVRGDFSAALSAAERALKLDSDFLPALSAKTQALYATRQFSPAWELSQKLLERAPDDPGMLFYHAKLAHEAHAYEAESAALRKLITLAEQAGASPSGYRVYLGQAYASAGDAENALDQLSLALLDTRLPREQRKFADQLFLQIKDRVGLPSREE